jgi:hypothetical protein
MACVRGLRLDTAGHHRFSGARQGPVADVWLASETSSSRDPDGWTVRRLHSRHHTQENREASVVHVPSVEEADARRLHRELERLKKGRPGHCNRIQALLVSQGVRLQPRHDLLERLEAARLWDGSASPAGPAGRGPAGRGTPASGGWADPGFGSRADATS